MDMEMNGRAYTRLHPQRHVAPVLLILLESYEKRRFRLGVCDCATFIDDVFSIVAGRRILGPSRKGYSTNQRALELLRVEGCASMVEFVTTKCQVSEIPPLLVTDGSIVTIKGVDYNVGDARLASPAVVHGGLVYGFSAGGLKRVPRSDIDRAFHINL